MSTIERSCPKLLRHMYTNSCCVNFCRHTKVTSLHLAWSWWRSHSPSISSWASLDANPSFGVPKLSEEFTLHHLPINSGVLQRPAYQVKDAPSSGCRKICNNIASFMAGGMFMTCPHHDMKWAMYWLAFLSCWTFKFGHSKFRRGDHWFNPCRISLLTIGVTSAFLSYYLLTIGDNHRIKCWNHWIQ